MNYSDIPICFCGVCGPNHSNSGHDFQPMSSLIKIVQNGKDVLHVNVEDGWPKKMVMEKCSHSNCKKSFKSHRRELISHPWKGVSYEKRIVCLELPGDAHCSICGFSLQQHSSNSLSNLSNVSHPINSPHVPKISIILENRLPYDDIQIFGPNRSEICLE